MFLNMYFNYVNLSVLLLLPPFLARTKNLLKLKVLHPELCVLDKLPVQ